MSRVFEVCPRCHVLRIDGCCTNGFNAAIRENLRAMDVDFARYLRRCRAMNLFGLIPATAASTLLVATCTGLELRTHGPTLFVGINVGLASMLVMTLFNCVWSVRNQTAQIGVLERRISGAPPLPNGDAVLLVDAAHGPHAEHTEQQRH